MGIWGRSGVQFVSLHQGEDRLSPLLLVGMRDLQSSELGTAQQNPRGLVVSNSNKNNSHLQGLFTFSKHFLFFYLFFPYNVHVRWVLSLPSYRQGNEARTRVL
jgi:hypothetical protein